MPFLQITDLDRDKDFAPQVGEIVETSRDEYIAIETYSACGENTVDAVRALLKGLRGHKSVMTLEFSFAQFETVDKAYVSQCLKLMTDTLSTMKVETLNLTACALGLTDISDLTVFMNNLPDSVTTLVLSFNDFKNRYQADDLVKVLASTQCEIEFDEPDPYYEGVIKAIKVARLNAETSLSASPFSFLNSKKTVPDRADEDVPSSTLRIMGNLSDPC